jgi:HlyD family secretion protein
MAENALFRKSALDKLASPERLDVLMQVTSPQGWIALWTIAVVLSIAVGWSLFGSLPERVVGRGLLIRGESNRSILAAGGGTIQLLSVREGDVVEVGQVVAEVSAATVNEEMTAAQARVDAAEREYNRVASEADRERASLRSSLADIDARLLRLQADLEAQERRLPERKDSLAKQIISQSSFDQFMANLRGLEAQVGAAQEQRRQSNQRLANIGGDIARSQERLESERNNYAIVLAGIGSATTITSNFSGRIVQLPKRQGDTVRPGETVAVVEESGAALQAAVFVPAQQGPRVKVGMPVQVDLSPTVQREVYGVLLGSVSYIGQFAATPAEVLAVMGEAQAQDYLQGGVFLVRVALTDDPATPSGFKWSSSEGPDQQISSGVTIVGDVIVDSKRPICRVLPVEMLCGSVSPS